MKKSIIISILLVAAFLTMNAQVQNNYPNIGQFTKSDLLKMASVFDLLKAVNPSADYSKYIVQSFDISISNYTPTIGTLKKDAAPTEDTGPVEYTGSASGDLLSEYQKKLIAEAKVDGRMYVEKIKVVEKNGTRQVIELPSINIKIKE